MKNAHERFGWLEFEKQLKDTRTRLRVALDRFISEPAENKEASGTCHLVSVFGNDVDIGAIWAGLAGQEWVTVSGPDLAQRRVTLGKDPRIFRGTIAVAGRSRSGSACRFILPGQVGFGACCNKNNVFSHWMVSDTGQSPSSEAKRSFWSGSGRP
jgi:hypothetical protein